MNPDSRTDGFTVTSIAPSIPTTLQGSSPTPDLPQADVEDYLERKNLEFVTSLAPTLSYIVLLMLCGLAGNSVVFAVYYRRFKPSVTRTYILAMSVVDLLTNVLSLPADIVEVRFHNTFQDRWLCKGIRTVKSFLGFLSACVLVAVALDRHQTICNPRSKPTRIRTIFMVLAFSGVLAMTITSPYSVLTGRQTVRYPDSNITGCRCSIDDAHVRSRFHFVYNLITGLVFVVCMVLMVVSYVRIARQLWLHKKNTSVTGRALGDSGAGTVHVTHTYIDEETCADGVQLSTDAKGKGEDSDLSDSSGQTGGHFQHNILTTSSSHAALALEDYTTKAAQAEDPHPASTNPSFEQGSTSDMLNGNGTNPRTTTLTADSGTTTLTPDSGTTTLAPDSRTATLAPDSRTATLAPDSRTATLAPDSGTATAGHLQQQSCSDSRLKGLNSAAKQPGQGSVLSRIRRTASDAKTAAVTRKKSVSRARGSVKKIPTRTTFMMFVLTVVFIVNYLPYLLLVSLRSRTGMESLLAALGVNGYHVGLRSYFLNSAVNPLVYSFCSARFRQECRRLLHCRGKRR